MKFYQTQPKDRGPKLWGRRRLFKQMTFGALSSVTLNRTLAGMGLLWSQSAFSQDCSAPKRYVLFHVPDACGGRPDTWHPTMEGDQVKLNEGSKTLEPIKEHMTFFDNLSGTGGHGSRYGYIANGKDLSIDIYLSQKIGQDTPFAWLGNALVGSGRQSKSERRGVAVEKNPFNTFNRLFSGGGAGGGGGGTVSKSVLHKRAVLDSQLDAIKDLQVTLGQVQRERMQAFAESIEKVDQSIVRKLQAAQGGDTGLNCSTPTWEGNNRTEAAALADAEFKADITLDLMALAFQCDMTRVIALSADRKSVVPGLSRELHAVAHGRDDDANTMRDWFNQKIVKLVQGFDNVDDCDGNSVLHNTVIHGVSDYGNGKGHIFPRAPLFLAGGGGGKLKTGQVISDLANDSPFQLLDTVADVFDVKDQNDYPQYGNGSVISKALKS